MGRLGKNIAIVIPCVGFALTREAAPAPALAFLLGLCLASAIEYAYHRFLLHGRRRTPLRSDHVAHHRAFASGEQIDPGDPREENLVEHPAVFPLGFALVYALLALVGLAWREILLATAVHYVLFEAAHWGTHVRGNPMDRVLLRIPWVGGVRKGMIDHHLRHHRRPDGDFSVLPPYAPDVVLGTKSARG